MSIMKKGPHYFVDANPNADLTKSRMVVAGAVGLIAACYSVSMFCEKTYWSFELSLECLPALLICYVLPVVIGIGSAHETNSFLLSILAAVVVAVIAPWITLVLYGFVGLIMYIKENPFEALLGLFFLSLIFAPVGGVIVIIMDAVF